jgi:hypothetical protein
MYSNQLVFKINIFKIEAKGLSQTKPKTIEYAVKEKVPEAKDTSFIDTIKDSYDLLGLKCLWRTTIGMKQLMNSRMTAPVMWDMVCS